MVVGFDPKLKKKLTKTDFGIAGAVSGSITRGIFQPLDVVKIRFQLQIEPIHKSSASSKYKGVTQAFYSIAKEEGIQALWKGHVPAQSLSIVYGILQFVSFEALTLHAWKQLPMGLNENWRPVVHFGCGGLSGCIATVGAYPFDVIRTRLVAQGEPKIYAGMLHAASDMLLQEGPRSFYKGLLPALIQIFPYAGAQFGFYRLFQELWHLLSKSQDLNWLQLGICGGSSGMVAKTIVFPLDLVKKRLQIQGFEKARQPFGMFRTYNNVTTCLLITIKDEGIRGLYKGLCPSAMKAACSAASHFLLYEQACNILSLKYS